MNAREAAVFPATAQVNTGNQTLATVATEKPRFGEIVAIFAIGLCNLNITKDQGAAKICSLYQRRASFSYIFLLLGKRNLYTEDFVI